MRTAYKARPTRTLGRRRCLSRTFGCVRVVWNRTLADRQRRCITEGEGTPYREIDAALSAWKKTGELSFLSEVSSVPLQQALRHQHNAFQAFFAKRGRYPRFKSRRGMQSEFRTKVEYKVQRARRLVIVDR